MSDLNVSVVEQTGGWFKVAIVPLYEVLVCPDILTNDNASSVVFAESDSELDILPVGENIKITEVSSKTKSGILYTIKGEFEIAYQSAAIDTFFHNLLQTKVLLIGVKHGGQKKIYGSKKFPLQFSYQFINGQKYEDGSKVKVFVSGKTPQKPVFIND